MYSPHTQGHNVRRETDFLDYGSTKPNIEVSGMLHQTKIHIGGYFYVSIMVLEKLLCDGLSNYVYIIRNKFDFV